MNLIPGRIARVLFSIPFILSGLMHFPNADSMSSLIPAYIPGPIFWVYVTGVVLIVSGISIITGKHTVLGCKLLALFLLLCIVTIHLPTVLAGGATAHMGMVSLLKDTSLLGASVAFLEIYEREMI